MVASAHILAVVAKDIADLNKQKRAMCASDNLERETEKEKEKRAEVHAQNRKKKQQMQGD